MIKGIATGIIFTLVILIILAVPAVAENQEVEEYRYTGTVFSYMGKVFHEKEFVSLDGSGFFSAEGMGTAGGYHHLHTKTVEGGFTTNIDLHLSGSTFADNSLELARIERETIARLEASRTRDIANLNRQLQENPGMPISEYERLMTAINAHYNAMISEVHEQFSDSKQNMRILSKVTANDSESFAGIEMNPGEEGYIKQTVASTKHEGGEYLRIKSHIKNSGGITAKSTDIKSGGQTFISENMQVIGSADLWESTRVQRGNAKTGWWDTTP